MQRRVHILALPHTTLTEKDSSCALRKAEFGVRVFVPDDTDGSNERLVAKAAHRCSPVCTHAHADSVSLLADAGRTSDSSHVEAEFLDAGSLRA